MPSRFGLFAVLAFTAMPAAAEQACYIPYTMFEAMVPHIDLDACPVEFAADTNGFCRLALDGDTVRIYAFAYSDDDACLERLESLPFADFSARHGTRYSTE
ncbi:hypothetical protein [Microbaculum marinisediminis]|uniref:Uncharacterized protein n=1 Tax=Microbaculum marinisediminis TaxID=2931392 RepID=A0AAW5QX88_9HYPH|nr:hypothetical protein [Microbaculum sp. A6E488]MCT8970954.1 hypothetical protein [Microbaculum sp. A6E488]